MFYRFWAVVSVVVVGISAGCEARQGSAQAEHKGNARKSGELESCGRTADCKNSFVCVNELCEWKDRDPVGDYHVARARAFHEKGRGEDAALSYQAAIVAFGAKATPIPSEVLCEYGRVLSEKARTQDDREESARLLHECVYAVPTGSSQRWVALKHLGKLHSSGLDPNHLARKEEATKYLSARPSMSDETKIRIAVSTAKRNSGPVQRKLATHLESAAVVASLRPCVDAHYGKTGEKRIDVTLRFQHGFLLTKYEDFDRATLAVVGEPAQPNPEWLCVRDAILPPAVGYIEKMGRETRWTETFRIVAGF